MTLPASAQRVTELVDDHSVVSSQLVAAELSVTRNRALQVLRALVRAGVLDVRLVDGGCYEWRRR